MMLMPLTPSGGLPDPTLKSVPLTMGVVDPLGTLPKFMGLGAHPVAPKQKLDSVV